MKRSRILVCMFVLLLFVWMVGMFSISAHAQTVDCGTCGENLTWSIDSEGTLTVSGAGTMPDYINYSLIPWYEYCSAIKRVVIGNGVTRIGSFSFYNCPNLTSLTVGASVESVGSNAFGYCYRLAEVINKSSLEISAGSDDFGYIGTNAIEVHDGESKIIRQGDYVFYSSGAGYLLNYLGNETDLVLPVDFGGSAAYAIWQYAFYENSHMTSVVIPKDVVTVGSYAFAYCEKLESVTMGEGLSSVLDYAFAYNDKLTNVNFSEGETLSIGSYAFYDCDGLRSIDLPLKTSAIGSGAFYSCGKLEHITIGDAATSIGNEAFKYCSKLKSIKIGSNITSIGADAFKNCVNLKIVYIHSSIVAAILTSSNACGDLIHYAETVLTEKSIANIDTTVLAKFSFTEELNHEGIEYVSYSSHAHIWQDYSEERVPCEQAGFEGAKCIECSLVKGNSVPMHNFIACAGHGASSHWDVCEDCGEIANQTAHTPNRTTSNCTDIITCKICLYTIKVAFNHDHSEEWTVDLEPTCAEKGSKSRHCSRCEDKADVTEIPKVAHTPGAVVQENRINATCTTEGSYDSVIYCAKCSAELSRETKTIEKVAHSFGVWIPTLAPSCTEPGEEERECFVCHEKETQTVEEVPHTPSQAVEENRINATCATEGGYDSVIYCAKCSAELSRETKTIEKVAHSFGEWNQILVPACTRKGEVVRECSVCHAKETKSVAALGHEHSTEWTVDLAPTCTEAGSKSHHCIRCTDKTDVTVIFPSGHSFADWCETKAPTCTEAGEQERECSVCHAKETKSVAALGHEHSTEWTVDLAPTCTEKGSKSHHCIRCADKVDVTAMPATNHNFADWYETKAPTCTATGIMERKCSICQNKETAPVPVLDHTPASAVEENRTNATCVADGSYDSVVYCAVCASEISRESKTLVKIGHDYSLEWTVDLAPTCTEKGSKSHHCTRCAEKTDVAEIPKAEHTPLDAVEENRVNASCTEDGSYDSVIYCSACSAELSRESKTLSKLGHDYGTEWTVDLDPTCMEEGSKSHHCSRCTEKADVTAIAKSAHTYGDIWRFDGEHHFKECTCGDTFAQAHTWNAGEVTKQATKEAEGEKTFTCTVCSKTKTESIPKLPVPENEKEDSFSMGAVIAITACSTAALCGGGFSILWFVLRKRKLL